LRRGIYLLIALLSLVANASPASASVRGIDVSHWKGAINWPRVAGSGPRFAFAEATNGFTVDWTYARNRAGAKGAGLAFGAFHLARPSGSTPQAVLADARAEGDFFVALAHPDTGDLAPVLDVERTGGLSPPSLRAWVAAWLDEVELSVGARPTIYASPTFWRRALGDAGVFAARGSSLWVAHWHVRRPAVPALNWGAGGWTFWQWTNCSRVRGIRGCVDGDVYRGSRVAAALLAPRPLSLTPPTVVGVPQTGEELSASAGTWEAAASPTLAYRWERCADTTAQKCAAIADAVTSAYTVTSADAGRALRVVVTATSAGRSVVAASTAVPVNA
jgi:GH25 family lysozyme M1 (1,4-beta-N-acetylmuramidase)